MRMAIAIVIVWAGCGPDVPCGDLALKARYPACRAAVDNGQASTGADCEKVGGEWNKVVQLCFCQTGDGGCPCGGPGECLGECSAPETGLQSCAGVGEGTCSGDAFMWGCACRFLTSGIKWYCYN
jgi:hypothetical protein